MKFDEVFVLHEEPIYDPKLIFPEQFEMEFRSLAQGRILNGRKLVIAIDDIDRCEPSVIKDILISAKNFIGHENCFFIVPCDDKTVIDIFADPNQKEGYRDESLRKYFNVTLRIPPITSTDLVDFANTVVRQTGIPDDIVQLAVMANCRDARKMKHFLNSLEMKYQVAKAREADGLMPKIVDDNLLELAKVVLIENAYPSLFSKLVENPRILELLEEATLKPEAPEGLGKYGLTKWEDAYPGLREVLERTREIKMAHADVFFPLKSANTEIRIPRGTELKTAIVEGNVKLVDEIASAIGEGGERIADLLLDLLNRTTGTFLRNTIGAALKLYYLESLFSPSERMRVGRELLRMLISEDRAAILSYPAPELLRCAEETGAGYASRILDEYYSGIETLASTPIPDNLSAIVLAIFKFSTDRARFAKLLNEKFAIWSEFPEGLAVLDNLDELNKLPEQEKIPSHVVVLRILRGLGHDSTKFAESDVTRRKLLFANLKGSIAEDFARVLILRLEGLPSEPSYYRGTEFAISSILLYPNIVETDAATELWPLIPPLFDALTDAKGKAEVTRACIVFGSRSKDTNILFAAQEYVLRIWRTVSDPLIREEFNFVKSIDSPHSQELLRQGVEQELDSIRSEMQRPSDRTAQRVTLCLDYSESIATEALEKILIEALDTASAESLKKWLATIQEQQGRLGQNFADKFALRCLEVVSSSLDSVGNQHLLLKAFVEILPTLSGAEKGSAIDKYFSLLRAPEPAIRNAAASRLQDVRDAAGDSQDFKLSVAKLIKYLRDEVKTSELLEYQAVFSALLSQDNLLREYETRDVANMAKALMSQTDDSLQEFGLSLVEQIPTILNNDHADVIHLLIGIARSTPGLKDRASGLLTRFSPGDLEENAARELTEWRGPET
jgi:hypothetical protein